MSNAQKPARLFFFSHPRTNSNLFMKLLGGHPAIKPLSHPMVIPHRMSVEELWNDPDGEILKLTFKSYQEASGREMTWQTEFDGLLRYFKDCEQENKIALVDEHAHYCIGLMDPFSSAALENRPTKKIEVDDTLLDLPENVATKDLTSEMTISPTSNPTFFPDRVWKSFSPIFIIRHPARTVPSLMRGMLKVAPKIAPESARNKFDLDYRWPRMIFDSYRNYYHDHLDGDVFKTHPYPIVVDGTDLINDPENIMSKICDIIGISPSEISYSWDPVPESQGALADVFLGTLKASSSVNKNNKPLDVDPSIEEEGKKWKEEFGEHTGDVMIKLANSVMPDFKYLWNYRLQ